MVPVYFVGVPLPIGGDLVFLLPAPHAEAAETLLQARLGQLEGVGAIGSVRNGVQLARAVAPTHHIHMRDPASALGELERRVVNAIPVGEVSMRRDEGIVYAAFHNVLECNRACRALLESRPAYSRPATTIVRSMMDVGAFLQLVSEAEGVHRTECIWRWVDDAMVQWCGRIRHEGHADELAKAEEQRQNLAAAMRRLGAQTPGRFPKGTNLVGRLPDGWKSYGIGSDAVHGAALWCLYGSVSRSGGLERWHIGDRDESAAVEVAEEAALWFMRAFLATGRILSWNLESFEAVASCQDGGEILRWARGRL